MSGVPLLLAFTMPHATSVTVHVFAQKGNIIHMLHQSELRNLRSDGLHFKNKYKSIILKSTMMSQIKEAFVRSQRKYKIYITRSFGFCSDVSFIGTIFSRNWHLLFVLNL